MSMVKVECDACKSPYQVEERRIPATGLKMRCSKCGNSILVRKPAEAASGLGGAEEIDLPSPVAPRAKAGTEPMMPRPAAGKAPAAPLAPKPPVLPAAKPKPAAPAPAPKPAEATELELWSRDDDPGFGEIDLPSPAKATVRQMHAASVPAPEAEEEELADLPMPAKATVRQMPAVVNEFPLDDEEEEDAALAAIEMPASSPNKPTVRQMTTPVTSSLEVDLPSPSPSPSPARAAAARTPPPSPPKAVDKPTAPARPAAKGFGEIDLPSPARPAAPKPPPPKPDEKLTAPARPAAKAAPAPEIDLPSPARPGMKSTPAFDLPSPARPAPPAAKGFGEIDLPAAARPPAARPAPPAAKGFGEIDLPAPARAPVKNEPADLPAPAPPGPKHRSSGAMRAPMRAKPLSSFDLPAVTADTELDLGAFGEIELPAPDLGAFGEIDLPAPDGGVSFADLEAPLSPPAGAARKLDPGATVPAASIAAFDPGDSDFGELEFPLASAPPPSPAAPLVSPPRAAAPVTTGFELDDAAFDAAFADPPPNKAAAPPKAPTPEPPKSTRAAGPISAPGEEFSLGEPDMDLSTGAPISVGAPPSRAPLHAADEPDEPAPPPDSRASIGDEVDLAPGESEDLDALGKRDKAPKSLAKPAAGDKRARGRGRVYGIGAAVLIAIGGGALALLPDIGPFGVHAVSDLVNASAHAEALTGLEKNTQATLDEDTAAAAARGLEAAKAAQASRPRHRPTAAYAAFVAFSRSLRHGRRGDDETLGKQLLGQTETPSRERTLAVAAQHALAGRLDPARRLAKDALDADANDIDAAVLLGEIELASGSIADALPAWKRAVTLRKGARSLYGLARAELAKGDAASAEKSARAALEASPKHAGARTLLASILGRDPAKETEALDILGKVTAEGDIRASGSDRELVDAYIETGRIHLARSRITAAEQAFAAALKIDPRSAPALIGDGELFYRSSRFSQALLRFEEATRVDESSIPARIGATKTLLALERLKDAKALAEKLRADKPDAASPVYWLGRAEDALGNKKEAEALYLQAIKLGGTQIDAVEAYVALASILAAAGRNDEAQAKLAEASAKFPDLAALHRAKGEVFSQAGRYAEARTEFEAALAKEDDLGTRFRLGITLRRMGAFEDAQKVFDQIAAVDKAFPGLSLERGLLYEETGQSERALEMYAAALEKAPTDIDLKMRVGSAQVMAGHAAQAEPILREVLKERAGSADANHFLGRALLLKGGSSSAGEAIRFLERATEIDGNRAEYFLYVGWAANVLGQFPKAEAALKRALELDRELADVYWQRGVLAHKQGRTLDALADLEIALQKRPSRHEAHATMALCYQELGRWPEAQTAWQKAIAGNGSVAEWHYRLGKIFESNGNKLAATPELDKAVELLAQKGGPAENWQADVYFLHAEAMRATGQKDKAVKSYLRFKEVASMDNAYRTDVERALVSLGHGP
ncbi:tetratricopeptide repeat protein [Polyangium sorediatum]|uniref:Tetratricopeptide repeat protein n=1 Tax=Polyangium sorediatum TaxID=889274 RepID=A0ABT6NXJ9_9BACT|nr:tetratricopeptide repeat protein [Polyangium sorediatum]MDI1432857.1 tetratricopeptide repeat protein [Polyangium sorediatum]